MDFKEEQQLINKLRTLRQVVPNQRFIDRVSTLTYSLPPAQTQKTPLFAFRAVAFVLVFVFLISAGAVYAAQSSLPGQLLYPVKKTLESVRIRLATDSEERANLQIQLIDERFNELRQLSEKQDEVLDNASLEYEKAVNKALEKANEGGGNKKEILEQLEEKLDKHSETLQETAQQAPSQAQDALDKALEVSQKGASVAKESLEKQSPNSVPTQTPSESQSEHPNEENLPNNVNPKGRR